MLPSSTSRRRAPPPGTDHEQIDLARESEQSIGRTSRLGHDLDPRANVPDRVQCPIAQEIDLLLDDLLPGAGRAAHRQNPKSDRRHPVIDDAAHVDLSPGLYRDCRCQLERGHRLGAAVIAHADPSELRVSLGLISAWRNRERAFEVTEQLAHSLADSDVSLGPVTAGADHQKIAVLTRDDAVERASDGQIGLDREPRVGGELVSDLGQHRPRLLADALPVQANREHHDRFGMDCDEHQLRARRPTDRRAQRGGVPPLGITVDADSYPLHGGAARPRCPARRRLPRTRLLLPSCRHRVDPHPASNASALLRPAMETASMPWLARMLVQLRGLRDASSAEGVICSHRISSVAGDRDVMVAAGQRSPIGSRCHRDCGKTRIPCRQISPPARRSARVPRSAPGL